MKLTEAQETYIDHFMDEASAQVDGWPADARAHYLLKLKTRVRRELYQSTKSRAGGPTDEDVLAVLALCRTAFSLHDSQEATPAAVQAAPVNGASSSGDEAPPVEDDIVLLGVCRYWAERFEVPASNMRVLFLALGVLGPLSVVVYLGLYAEMYLTTEPARRRPVDVKKVRTRASFATGVVVLLGCAGAGLVSTVDFAFLRYAGYDVFSTGSWAWLEHHGWALFGLVFVTAVPLGALSGTPLPNEWEERTVKTVKYVIWAYAVLTALGTASYLVGVLVSYAGRVV